MYKDLVKENELLTKLKIIRLTNSPRFSKKEVAKIFNCHRNTVSSLCKKFKSLPENTQNILLKWENLNIEEIEFLLSSFKNKSSKPHSHPKQPSTLEDYSILWLFYERGWRVGYSSMHTKINRSFRDYQKIDPHLFSLTKLTVRQIRGIYSRYDLRSKKVKTKTGKRVPLYDYAALGAFERMHLDVKVLPDQKSLPTHIYDNLLNNEEIPKYQWTLIDAKTRFRFVAYSHNINSEFGLKFLIFTIMHIRFTFNNWDVQILIGMDNGIEFCSGSEKKLKKWNDILEILNALCYQYNPYFDVRKNIVERSHRTDDSHFLIPRGDLLVDKASFLEEVTSFFYYFNFERGHTGINMFNRTPYEALKDTGLPNPERLLTFPVMILEDHIETIRKTTEFLMFQTEVFRAQQKKNRELSQKQLIDISLKYSFFDSSAQKVLTKYPHFELTIRKFKMESAHLATRGKICGWEKNTVN